MKKMLFLPLYFLVVGCIAPLTPSFVHASSSARLLVEDLRVESVNYDAEGEYAWFVVSCTVQNLTEESGNVSVDIRTIDKWAYDKKPLQLTGYVKAGERKKLSVLNFMDNKMFKSLRKYELKSVALH